MFNPFISSTGASGGNSIFVPKGTLNSVEELPQYQEGTENNPEPGWLYFVKTDDPDQLEEYVFTEEHKWEKLGYVPVATINGIKLEGDLSSINDLGIPGKIIDPEDDLFGSEIFNNYENNVVEGEYCHAEGSMTTAVGECSHAEGQETTAQGYSCHAEGEGTTATGKQSHAEGTGTTASGGSSHAEGDMTAASGENSHAEGWSTKALGNNSHAEGEETIAGIEPTEENPNPIQPNSNSHAEGKQTIASGEGSHAEGVGNVASGEGSHAEGGYILIQNVEDSGEQFEIKTVFKNIASGTASHAEGVSTKALGEGSHAEGYQSIAGIEPTEENPSPEQPKYSHAEGRGTASGDYSHAEGGSRASGEYSHAEGAYSQASGDYCHAEGRQTTASSDYTHSEGGFTKATGKSSHAEGYYTTASGKVSHAEGDHTKASGDYSHAEGYNTAASGSYSHAEGWSIASGEYSHAEGISTKASGSRSHAEGSSTTASGDYSHSEGASTKATGDYSHAEGNGTTASGDYSHAEGFLTTALELISHAEGWSTKASGVSSHAEGKGTIAASSNQHVQGKYNVEDTKGKYAFIIGNGKDFDNRSNAFAVDWLGKIYGNNPERGIDINDLFASKIEEVSAVKKNGYSGENSSDYCFPVPQWCNYWAPNTNREETKQGDVLAIAIASYGWRAPGLGVTFINGFNGGNRIGGGIYEDKDGNMKMGGIGLDFDFYSLPGEINDNNADGQLGLPPDMFVDSYQKFQNAKCCFIKLKEKAIHPGTKVYGYHVNPNEENPSAAVTYLADAIGKYPARMGTNGFNYGSWEDAFFMPKPCMLKYDGTVAYYLNPDDYSKKLDGTPSDISNPDFEGNAMMEWGLLWYKFVGTEDGGGDFYIANTKVDNDYNCWCNYNGYNQDITPHFYTAIYNSTLHNDKFRSLSGFALTEENGSGNKTGEQEVTYCTANNTGWKKGWYTDVYADRILINALHVLISKSLNTQASFGRGLDIGDEATKNAYITGTLNNKGLFYGVTANGNSAVKTFGMENWWGCTWHRTAGCIAVEHEYKIKLTPWTLDGSTVYEYNSTGEGYVSVGTIPSTNGYIKKFKYDKYGYMPFEVGGSDTSYYTDYYMQASGTYYLLAGGATNSGTGSGAFYFNLSSTFVDSFWSISTNLSCKPYL